MEENLKILLPIVNNLQGCNSSEDKLRMLLSKEAILHFVESHPALEALWSQLEAKQQLALASLIFIGQAEPLCSNPIDANGVEWQQLIKCLVEIDQFYAPIGGIAGYHVKFLQLLQRQKEDSPHNWRSPPTFDLLQESVMTAQAIRWAIGSLPELAHIFLVGGAAERLKLQDELTGAPKPAAALPFRGRTLLEGLFRDTQALEYLYYQLNSKQLNTPIVLMSSSEKGNDGYIHSLCASHNWFGRQKHSMRMICQAMAPMIDEQGRWVWDAPLKLLMKPGGHGVVWTLAEQQGCFDWLRSRGSKKLLMRQINNPIAGVDNGLLTLVGLGCHEDKDFGFATCQRIKNLAEGMIVLEEQQQQGGYRYWLSNIEYTQTASKLDTTEFAANANILFADIAAVQEAIKIEPFPGLLINMKTERIQKDVDGVERAMKIGRLESTMQNISDQIFDSATTPLDNRQLQSLRSFTTYNSRHKTISATKYLYDPKGSLMQTQLGAYYDWMRNCYELLTDYCGYSLPPFVDEQQFLKQGPNFICDYHPALGPLYSIIGQKIQKGMMEQGSELYLEISQLCMNQLDLKGSLRIVADQPIGAVDELGVLAYGVKQGSCILRDVEVVNRGIDWSWHDKLWCGDIRRHESCEIIIHGNGEFVGESVTFAGPQRIEVADGQRLTAYMHRGELCFKSEPIIKPSWNWKYSWGQGELPVQLAFAFPC